MSKVQFARHRGRAVGTNGPQATGESRDHQGGLDAPPRRLGRRGSGGGGGAPRVVRSGQAPSPMGHLWVRGHAGGRADRDGRSRADPGLDLGPTQGYAWVAHGLSPQHPLRHAGTSPGTAVGCWRARVEGSGPSSPGLPGVDQCRGAQCPDFRTAVCISPAGWAGGRGRTIRSVVPIVFVW